MGEPVLPTSTPASFLLSQLGNSSWKQSAASPFLRSLNTRILSVDTITKSGKNVSFRNGAQRTLLFLFFPPKS